MHFVLVGIRLYRGFNEEAFASDKLCDVTHLCFLIHGVGQSLGLFPIVRSCDTYVYY